MFCRRLERQALNVLYVIKTSQTFFVEICNTTTLVSKNHNLTVLQMLPPNELPLRTDRQGAWLTVQLFFCTRQLLHEAYIW